ncbi:hypothetical protein SKTS_10350 [Sulfurimicrobium lacus]|uniref:Uncharacterized protein n=1 Tax=Sulfurimicrobium lacus TaxID=2715678 RepID=A0A6F8VBM6_9PROT|nr:hypothetical protein [Sulfurimicrobium lacus]BCB26149.1 hypothetical protein SKTS_10350 [Sulfurimicrobium lacus]
MRAQNASNPALNLAPFSRWTLRDKAAQRRLAPRWASGGRMLRKVVLYFALACSASGAYAEEALHTFNIVLLQPDFVLQERVQDVTALSTYIKEIESSVSGALQAKPHFPPTGGFIVVAVKPGQKSNVWLDFKPMLNPQTTTTVLTAARSVPPVAVSGGVVVFAIKVGLWGGLEPKSIAPSPAEWKAAAKKAGHPLETGDLVEGIWRD